MALPGFWVACSPVVSRLQPCSCQFPRGGLELPPPWRSSRASTLPWLPAATLYVTRSDALAATPPTLIEDTLASGSALLPSPYASFEVLFGSLFGFLFGWFGSLIWLHALAPSLIWLPSLGWDPTGRPQRGPVPHRGLPRGVAGHLRVPLGADVAARRLPAQVYRAARLWRLFVGRHLPRRRAVPRRAIPAPLLRVLPPRPDPRAGLERVCAVPAGDVREGRGVLSKGGPRLPQQLHAARYGPLARRRLRAAPHAAPAAAPPRGVPRGLDPRRGVVHPVRRAPSVLRLGSSVRGAVPLLGHPRPPRQLPPMLPRRVPRRLRPPAVGRVPRYLQLSQKLLKRHSI